MTAENPYSSHLKVTHLGLNAGKGEGLYDLLGRVFSTGPRNFAPCFKSVDSHLPLRVEGFQGRPSFVLSKDTCTYQQLGAWGVSLVDFDYGTHHEYMNRMFPVFVCLGFSKLRPRGPRISIAGSPSPSQHAILNTSWLHYLLGGSSHDAKFQAPRLTWFLNHLRAENPKVRVDLNFHASVTKLSSS